MGIYAVTSEGEEALAAATAETLVGVLGATTVKARLVEWGVSFDGVTATDAPVVVELYQITTSGTSTGATEAKWDRSGPTAQCTGFHSFTVEPTKGDRIACYEIHPQGGGIVMQYPLGREPVISDASTSQGIGIVVTSPAVCNALAYMVWEE
jgi:hypothetical protein